MTSSQRRPRRAYARAPHRRPPSRRRGHEGAALRSRPRLCHGFRRHGYPMVISVAANSPTRTFADLIARAKTGRITFATSGPGSLHDLVGELVNVEAGIGMVSVRSRARRSASSICRRQGGRDGRDRDFFLPSDPRGEAAPRSRSLPPGVIR